MPPDLRTHLQQLAIDNGVSTSTFMNQTLALATGFSGQPITASQATYTLVRRLAYDYARRMVENSFAGMPENFDEAVALGLIDPNKIRSIIEPDPVNPTY